VDTHLLRTFVTVSRLGSFSAAAVELRYTQAAVSQQIAALENDLKVTLLNRRPVTPTEAGARLLEHAEPILLRLDAARADVTRMTLAPPACLVAGLTPLAGCSPAVALALATLRQQMPRLDVTVRVASRPNVATGVARGEFGIGLIDGLAAPGDPLPVLAPLSAVGVSEAEVAVVLPADHPLARRAGVRLADLVDARWIEAPGVAPPLSDVRRVAGTDGFRAAFQYDGMDTLSLIRLAAAGDGIALLPATVALVAGSEVSAVTVTAPRMVHRVEFVHGSLRDGSPAAALTDLLSARG
jgi:DNA-binding transcriptional LysR family regulator